MFTKNTDVEFIFFYILKQESLKFPMQNSKNFYKIMIKVNLYMHFLTIDEVQQSALRNVQ
jgi:hypothetical protein